MPNELADVKGNAEGLLYTCDKSLEEYGHVLPEHVRRWLLQAMDSLRSAVATTDIDRIRERIRAVESLAEMLAAALYAAPEAGSPERSGDVPPLPTATPPELQAIFGYLMRSARELIGANGAVWPIAAVIDPELGLAAFIVIDESPEARLALDVLQERLDAAWARGEYSAAGTLVQIDPIDESSSDAVLVQLEHEDGTSLAVLVAFTMRDGALEWGAVTVRVGATIELR
jgi:hypothetical protein